MTVQRSTNGGANAIIVRAAHIVELSLVERGAFPGTCVEFL
jgi:hypothetical protein